MKLLYTLILSFTSLHICAQTTEAYILKPDQVFDGFTMHSDWVVFTKADKIIYAGSEKNAPTSDVDVKTLDLPGTTPTSWLN